MPLDPASIPQRAKPAPVPYLHVDPYRAWAQTMFVGALVATFGYMIESAWGFAWLSSRVRSHPPGNFLRSLQPYVAVAAAGLAWVGMLVLTIDDPIPHASRGRFRAGVLRLIATISALATCAYSFRLIDEAFRRRFSNQIVLGIELCELTTAILLWLHLRWTAGRLGLRGVRWRALVALLAYSIAMLINTWPRVSAVLLDRPFRLTYDYRLLSDSTTIVCATVVALVMARFAASFRAESLDE